MGKPRGLRTARKHVKNRRTQVWADLDYKKANLGTRWKANPFGGASHAKGIVLEKVKYNYADVKVLSSEFFPCPHSQMISAILKVALLLSGWGRS